MSNIAYIGTSLDGYIADKHGGLEWLEQTPNPNNLDCGWGEFMARIDAIVMGRNTFETVCGFDCDWPYIKPVFVLSNTLKSIPATLKGKAELLNGPLQEVIKSIHQKGFKELYIDGGITIQNFLKEDLIDEIIVTVIPTLLGGGSPLFGELKEPLNFERIKTEVLLDALVKNHYRRSKS